MLNAGTKFERPPTMPTTSVSNRDELSVAASGTHLRNRAILVCLCWVLLAISISREFSTTYRGQIVAFCNEHCRDEFAADPEKYPSDRTFFDRIIDDQ